MIGYINPKVVLLPEPVGLDLAIQEVQLKLSTITWLDKAYGRAILQRETVTRNDKGEARERENIFPEVYGPKQEPLNLLPNANLKSYCFFIARDPGTFLDYEAFENQQIMTHPISLIFWFNLKKIDPALGYRFTEKLKNEVIKLLTTIPNIILTQTYEQWEKVFEGMTLTSTFKQYLKPPYGAFRIDASIHFNQFHENC